MKKHLVEKVGINKAQAVDVRWLKTYSEEPTDKEPKKQESKSDSANNTTPSN
ncbi:MAG: hypothetical protein FD167_4246 [bacterium]|nr:MAG: hypothetical protein FD167_4246 [bacterium]